MSTEAFLQSRSSFTITAVMRALTLQLTNASYLADAIGLILSPPEILKMPALHDSTRCIKGDGARALALRAVRPNEHVNTRTGSVLSRYSKSVSEITLASSGRSVKPAASASSGEDQLVSRG